MNMGSVFVVVYIKYTFDETVNMAWKHVSVLTNDGLLSLIFCIISGLAG